MDANVMVIDSPQARRVQVDILGIAVDDVTMEGALRTIENFVASDRSHIVVTADASGIYIAQGDPDYRRILIEADLVTPDSVGVLWAAKKRGHALPERVSGVDLVDRICEISARRGFSVYFLGAAPGVADLAAETLRAKYPGCNIVGTRHGYFDPADDEAVAREVAAFHPDVLFVAMGIPRQEKFIAATRSTIRAKAAIGVGGSLDVFSGRVKRAPKAVQKLRLEWLWRTALNPKKISKAKCLPKFAWRVLRSPK